MTAKFLCKCITAQDFMSSVLLQAESSLQVKFQNQLSAIKEFLAWKQGARSTRQIQLGDIENVKLAHYSEEEMGLFLTKTWSDRIVNRCQIRNHTSDIDHVLTNILSNEETGNLQLNKNNFVFNYGTKKELDSYIQDYIHGNSLIFGNIRSSTSNRKESKLCYFCNKEIDSPVHQLLLCTEVAEVTQCNLLRNISSQNEFLKEILFSSSDELHKTFIERVQFLKGQHESVINDPED